MAINRINFTSKILTDLCFTKQRIKTKNYFCTSCLQRFSSKNVSTKHKEVCLSINGAQSVRLEKGTIEFKNHFKQIPVPFETYADLEYNLKSVESYEGSYSKKYQYHIPCSFAYKLFCVDHKFTKPIVVFRVKNAAYNFIQAILKGFEYSKKVMKTHFNKNLIMSEKEEGPLKPLNHEKVRDHCYVNGKFRGAAHWSCNITIFN